MLLILKFLYVKERYCLWENIKMIKRNVLVNNFCVCIQNELVKFVVKIKVIKCKKDDII